METLNRIAIVGGTGKAGRCLAQKALESGYRVRLLARNPVKAAINDSRIEVVAGDARSIESMRSLLEGCHTVINTIGRPPKETPLYSDVTSRILTVMREQGIRRYIGVTGGSLNVEGDRKSLPNKIVARLFAMLYSEFIADKRKELELLASSDLEWTLVRLPFVVEGRETGRIREHLTNMPGVRITNADIAKVLIGQINERTYIKRTPCISN